jgi:CHAT domain-containing protein
MSKYFKFRSIFAIEQALLVFLFGGVSITGLVTGLAESAIAQPSNKSEKSAEELLTEARRLIQAKQYAEALVLAKQAAQADDRVTEALITFEIFAAFYPHRLDPDINWDTALAIFSQLESVIAKLSPIARQDAKVVRFQYYAAAGKALAYFRQGNYLQSLQSSQAALLLAQQQQDQENIIFALGIKARTLHAIGQFNNALNTAEQRHKLCIESSEQNCQMQSLRMLAIINGSLGRYEKSIQFLQQSLAIARQTEPQPIIDSVLNDLAVAHIEARQNAAAKELLLSITPARRSATSLLNLGWASYELGQYSEAETYYQQSIQTAQKSGEKNIEANSLEAQATLYSATGRLEKSLTLFAQALGMIRNSQDKFLEGTALTHQGKAFLRLGKLKEAEKSLRLAVEISDSLGADLSDSNKIAYRETIKSSYELLQIVLVLQKKTTEALEISERVRARALADLLASKIETNSASAQVTRKVPNLSQIQTIAQQQNATLVEYSILPDDQLYIWVITPDGKINFQNVSLASQNLKALIQETRDNINQGNKLASQRNANLKALHRLLIQPIAQHLPQDPEAQVIFLPQNELFLVPFVALLNDQDEYLIEKHTITTAPSIQTLGLMANQKAKSPGLKSSTNAALVIGNPTMPQYNGKPLAPLPNSETEAIAIAEILNTSALIGKAATESAVKAKIQQASIVHLATHGLIDRIESDIPGAIALTNGYLTSSELFDMKLNADLVVLSACQTGNGDLTGDGVIGLSRSLAVAGVPSAIVSLWDVNDAATKTLMSTFYQNLTQKKLDKAQALRQATLSAMTDYDHQLGPQGWAAFTLIGDKR